MERSQGRPAGCGCALALGGLLIGVLLGAQLALGLIGLDFDYLLRRASGEAPVLVAATAVPTPLAAIQGAAPGHRIIWREPIELDSDTNEPDMLLISRNYDRGGDALVYLSADQRAARWESVPLGDNGNSWLVDYDAELIYVADHATLYGINRADGALRWEAPLSDEVQYSICQGCLRAANGVVVALSGDGVIQAFRGASGAPLWSVRLREATRQLVVFGDAVGAPDARPNADDSTAGLYLFNLADGAPARTIEPVCARADDSWEDRPHYYDTIYRSPDGNNLYWLLDSARCVVRASVSGLSAAQPVLLDDDFSLSTSNDVLIDGDILYLSDGAQLIAVGPDAARKLATPDDYSLRPLAVGGNSLLVEATRQRGSTRQELWAIDLESGQRRWERVLSGTNPLSGAFDTADWAAAVSGENVVLFEQRSDSESLVYELINLTDGASRASSSIPVEDADNAIRGLLTSRSSAFLVTDELYAVELSSGNTLYHFP